MAKKKRGGTRIVTSRKPFFRYRDALGHFLSKDAIEDRNAEQLERLADLAFLSPKEKHKFEKQKLRAEEVKKEKASRFERFRNKPELYRSKTTGANRKALDDRYRIEEEYWQANPVLLPPPTDIIQRGEYFEYIWMWQGPNALSTAQAFLLLAKQTAPASAMGYLAIGNGKGRNSLWAGTRMGTPRDIWRHSQTLMTSQSQNIKSLAEMPHFHEDSLKIWVEVKLTTKGRIHFENESTAGETRVNKTKNDVSRSNNSNGRAKLQKNSRRTSTNKRNVLSTARGKTGKKRTRKSRSKGPSRKR